MLSKGIADIGSVLIWYLINWLKTAANPTADITQQNLARMRSQPWCCCQNLQQQLRIRSNYEKVNILTSAVAFLLTVEMYFVHFHIIHRCHNPQEKLVKINISTYSLSIHIHYLAISKKAILRQTLFFLFASYIWSLKKTKHDMKEKCYESKS